MKVLILGAGIGGLATAYQLQRDLPGVEVTVLDRDVRPGGKIATGVFSWGTVERGAELIVAKYPEVSGLLHHLGLQLVQPAPLEFMIKSEGALQRIPRGILSPTSSLRERAIGELTCLTEVGRREALACLSLPPPASTPDRSLREVLEEHYGRELSEKVVAPVIAAIHGGDASSLSSLLYAPSPSSPLTQPALLSVRGGLSSLTDRLADEFKGKLQLSQQVTCLKHENHSWSVTTAQGEHLTCDHLVCCLPLSETIRLFSPFIPATHTLLDTVSFASTASVHVVFDFPISVPSISGYLVQSSSPEGVTGVSILHNKWPTRFLGQHSVFRVFVKYAGQKSRAEICNTALCELRDNFAITAEPSEVLFDEWPDGVQAYHFGHTAAVEKTFAGIRSDNNLSILSSSLTGTGIADAIREASAVAKRIVGTNLGATTKGSEIRP